MAMVSLARYATDAAASLPSTVMWRRLSMSYAPSGSLGRDRAGRTRPSADQPQQQPGVARDHQFLVGPDHPPRDPAAAGRDPRGVPAVGLAIELDAEPRACLADPLANLRGVLADPGGEHQRVDAAHHRGERADLLGRLVDEILDRQPRPRLVAAEQDPH